MRTGYADKGHLNTNWFRLLILQQVHKSALNRHANSTGYSRGVRANCNLRIDTLTQTQTFIKEVFSGFHPPELTSPFLIAMRRILACSSICILTATNIRHPTIIIQLYHGYCKSFSTLSKHPSVPLCYSILRRAFPIHRGGVC